MKSQTAAGLTVTVATVSNLDDWEPLRQRPAVPRLSDSENITLYAQYLAGLPIHNVLPPSL